MLKLYKDKLEICQRQEIFSYSAFICLITNLLCASNAKIPSLILTEGKQENVSFKIRGENETNTMLMEE